MLKSVKKCVKIETQQKTQQTKKQKKQKNSTKRAKMYLLFLFSSKQSISQARACIQRQRHLFSQQKGSPLNLAALHDDALNLMAEIVEMPQNGLVVTENVCFDPKVPIAGFESLFDKSGTNATIKARIAYYYTTS